MRLLMKSNIAPLLLFTFIITVSNRDKLKTSLYFFLLKWKRALEYKKSFIYTATIIKLLDKSTILRISRKHGGEHYIKRFDCWTHLVVMLYAVIMRFDSLREITASLQAEARKLCHLGISSMPSRSTLSDANKRRPEVIFESIYRDLSQIGH